MRVVFLLIAIAFCLGIGVMKFHFLLAQESSLPNDPQKLMNEIKALKAQVASLQSSNRRAIGALNGCLTTDAEAK